MARVRGVYLRQPPKGPSAYSSKEAALVANPSMVVVDAAFPKNRIESAKSAAFRVNSGGRGEWSSSEFFAIWEYAKDVVLRVKPGEGDGSVEVIGFEEGGRVIGDDGEPVGDLAEIIQDEGVETGGWILLIGVQPHVPEGWVETVSAPGSRKRRRRETSAAN